MMQAFFGQRPASSVVVAVAVNVARETAGLCRIAHSPDGQTQVWGRPIPESWTAGFHDAVTDRAPPHSVPEGAHAK